MNRPNWNQRGNTPNRFAPGQTPPPWVSGRDLDRARHKERLPEKEREAESLHGVLGQYLSKSSLGAVLVPMSDTFRETWRKVAGDMLAQRAQPLRFSQGILVLKVEDPAWKFELRYRLDDLAAALRAAGVQVREIRLEG